MTYRRFTTSAKPNDGHIPADWETPSRRGTIRLALLIAVGVFALALLGRGFGVN